MCILGNNKYLTGKKNVVKELTEKSKPHALSPTHFSSYTFTVFKVIKQKECYIHISDVSVIIQNKYLTLCIF